MINIASINDTIPLKGLMLLYQADSENVYVEWKTVNSNKEVSAGVPLSLDSLESLYTYMVNRKMGSGQLAGMISKNMIYMNPALNVYIWTVPSGKREIKLARGAGLRKGWIKYPPMVFAVNGKSLSIFIYSTSMSKLYPAPFYNIYDDGEVCLGTVRLTSVNNAKTYHEYTTAWENLFFNSKYSHGIGDTMKIMKSLINSRKPFPWKKVAKILKPINIKTLFV